MATKTKKTNASPAAASADVAGGSPGPAQLNLDIAAFHGVTTGQFSVATLSLTGTGGGLVTLNAGQIAVTGKVDFIISITSSVGLYIPVGIALVQKSNPPGSGNPNDPQGYTNFANLSWKGTLLQFTNNWKQKGKRGTTAPVWKMYVLIADLGAQPPTLGVIDPEISNED